MRVEIRICDPASPPSERCYELAANPSREGRSELANAIGFLLIEIEAWVAKGEPGVYSYFILDTHIDGRELYVQFFAEANVDELVTEVSSGFYAYHGAHLPTDAQRAAMVSFGYSDGRQGNFRKSCDKRDVVLTAEHTLSLLGNIFG